MPVKMVRTTLSLPAEMLAAQERAAIDASFLEMAFDATYQKEALSIASEFREADHLSGEI